VTGGETVAGTAGADFVWQQLDTLRVKGKTKPVDIFTPLRPAEAEQRREELARWEEARLCYVKGAFAEAESKLGALCDEFPETTLYAVMYDRVFRLRKEPPGFWNGVWVLDTK
jgi:adenylate cyclase